MAQLSDDAFAFGGSLMTVAEARELFFVRLSPVVETERVALAQADGRVLAQDIVSPLPLPPFDNSAVDGYAVRFDDLAASGETRLPIAGRLAAGTAAASEPAPGAAVRIFTGAPMPPGFDTVFMQEDVQVEADTVVLPGGLARGANRRLAGEDLPEQGMAHTAGRRLTPTDVALIGALGIADVAVRRRLRVGVFSTGDEVVEPGQPLGPAKLYDANRFMLLALLGRLGCAASDLGILPDEPSALTDALAAAAAEHDLLITSGGVSTGEEDHVKRALEAAGALTFWRVGIKPGRPVAMGVVRGAAVIGLPGNPVAAFVTFVQLARPLIARLTGEEFQAPLAVLVRSGFAYRKKEGRREYVRVRLEPHLDGSLMAHKHPREGAGVITSLTETHGLVELPEQLTQLVPGDSVGFLPYAALIGG
jgi:molybdopterin molybdotransferase